MAISRGSLILNLDVPAVGKKDRASRTEFGEYLSQLQFVAKKYVVLYDVENKRGWLVDEASALLHLVRASLRLSSIEDLMDDFIFSDYKLEEAPAGTQGRTAALAILKNNRNLSLRLYRKMGETFQDRVNTIYHLLEQALAHQKRVSIE